MIHLSSDLLSVGGSQFCGSPFLLISFRIQPNRCKLKYSRHDSRAQLISAYRNNTLLPGVTHRWGEDPGGIGCGTLRLGVPGIDVVDAGQVMLPVERWPDDYLSRTYRSCGSRGCVDIPRYFSSGCHKERFPEPLINRPAAATMSRHHIGSLP